ncbi:DUF4192 family protein [Kocuria nitroreducens]|uniref:DUF4192 family protein n=1 Tax=Kocuria nitroreducens TaxID=3058914 RepID=UPI0036DDA400
MRQHPFRDPFVPVVRCAADLLAVVPHTLGYWPADSLVLFAAGGGTAGACVRVDLPHGPSHQRLEEAFVAELADLVRHDALSDRVFVIVYTSSSPGDPPGVPVPPTGVDGVLADVDEAARRAGRAVAARWIVAGDRWWPAEEPADVQDVAGIEDSAVNAALVASGSSYAAAPRLAMDHEYGALPAGTTRGTGRAAVRWARAGEVAWHHLDRLGPALSVWADVLATVPGSPGDPVPAVLGHDDELLGFLAASLTDPVLADLLLVACATDDLDGVLAAAATWAELCDDVDDPADGPGADGVPVGPTCAPVPAGVPPVPRRPPACHGVATPGPAAATAPVPDAGELVRLSRVLAGEWAETPHWSLLDALYRVLQVLSWLLEPAGLGAGPGAGAAGNSGRAGADDEERGRVVLAGVLVELAQLNRFRARGSHTAHFVRRATALVPGHPSALRVLRLADARPVPFWARDRATAWHS